MAIWLIAAALVGMEVFSLTFLAGSLAFAAAGLPVPPGPPADRAGRLEKVWIIPSEFVQAMSKLGSAMTEADGRERG